MGAQNATTFVPATEAAMTPEQEATARNFGVPPVGAENPSAEVPAKPEEAPAKGQPAPEAKAAEADLEEKYRGKTPAELARMHKEAEKAMHEANQARSQAAKEIEARDAKIRDLSFVQEERARYERMVAERSQTPQIDPAKERFQKVVNPDPEVAGAVEDLSATAARKALAPEISTLRNTISNLQAQNYKTGLSNLMATDPDVQKLFPEIQQQAVEVGGKIAQLMYAAGASQDQVIHALEEFNRDLEIVPVLKTMVIGKKGPEYFAQALKTKTETEEDPNKIHLGGGGGAPSAGESGEMPLSEFNKLTTAQQRAHLKKIGAL